MDSLHRDGRHLRFTLIETPQKNQIEITTDITDAVCDHMEVERSRREVDAAEEIKKATVARFAQTIRVPMTGVLAAAEMLNDTDLDESQQDKLDIIRRSSGSLLGVMQDMMLTAGSASLAVPSEPEASGQPVKLESGRPRRAVLLVRSRSLSERLPKLLAQDSIQIVCVETVDLVLSLLSQDDEERVPVDFVMTDDTAALEVLRQWSSSVLSVNRPKIIDLNLVMKEGFNAETGGALSPRLKALTSCCAAQKFRPSPPPKLPAAFHRAFCPPWPTCRKRDQCR